MLVTLGIGRSELDQTLYQALEQVKNYEYAGEYDFFRRFRPRKLHSIKFFLYSNNAKKYIYVFSIISASIL